MAIPQYVECSLAHQNWYANANATHQARPEFATARQAYDAYRASLTATDQLQPHSDTTLVNGYVAALNLYKDEIDLLKYKTAFNAQTKFHSTVMEEFWGLLFGELLNRLNLVPQHPGQILYLGDGSALQNILFSPHSMSTLLGAQQAQDPWLHIRSKDRDFMIARKALINITIDGNVVNERTRNGNYHPVDADFSLLPIVTVECKQYVDKTMLDNAMAAADHRRQTAPHCLDLIAVELNKLSDWNIGGSGLDNFYLLRKQRLTDATFLRATGPIDTVDVSRRNPIYPDVVRKLYSSVRSHLESLYWRASEAELLAHGFVLGG